MPPAGADSITGPRRWQQMSSTYSNPHISGAIMIAVLQDYRLVSTSHGYSSGSRSLSALSVPQSDAAIRVMAVGGVFTALQQSNCECHLDIWPTAVAHSNAYPALCC